MYVILFISVCMYASGAVPTVSRRPGRSVSDWNTNQQGSEERVGMYLHRTNAMEGHSSLAAR